MPDRSPTTVSDARTASAPDGLPVEEAAALPADDVLARLGSTRDGLSAAEAADRARTSGPNAVRTHRARALPILARQFRNAVLLLLAATALAAFLLGDRTDAIVIGVILALSVGLGFGNEYRAARAADALHSSVRHTAVVLREGRATQIDVTALVPGDVVRLQLGEVVPADLRLLDITGLQCEESVLTGESLPVDKEPAPVPADAALGDLRSCAFMGTVVHAGAGTGVVVATGGRAAFGRIALGLGEREPETDFQVGLRQFSVLLLKVALVLTVLILGTNLVLQRPLIDSVLFSLAIAVGITPQLLPAVVATSLATGSRRLAQQKVLVKRLVAIEDLGDLDILVTDKTGTLTDGRISFTAALDPAGTADDDVLRLGLLATEADPRDGALGAVGGNALDAALWAAAGDGEPARAVGRTTRLGLLPFDHDRQLTTTVVRTPDDALRLVVKGAPEAVLAGCVDVPAAAAATLHGLFAAGSRVLAVASRPASEPGDPTPADERDLVLAGFLVFVDRPKASAAASLRRLADLGIQVKVCTGDNPVVAEKVCADLGLVSGGTLTGADLARMDEAALDAAVEATTVFARVSPEQKARIVRLLRRRGRAVGFLGDGVNDALALHAADVGISVDTATDVAKDAADVVLLEKDLGVLADGVAGGRRIFANTIKYVLMGTSSNFGNMFSMAAASAVLPFLPLLPDQILLNNLLYDSSQLAIPTDRVDPEQLRAPSHWDLALIRRFMLFFGPISSLFDFLTFALLLGAFSAGPELFRAGWFAESLATQTLVIVVIRTRRTPFFRSRPSRPLLAAALAVVLTGVALPFTGLGAVLGFAPPPVVFLLALAGIVIVYLGLVDVSKQIFFAGPEEHRPHVRLRGRPHRVHRRAARFSVPTPLSG
jgi:P-type Mg2+ transporter